MQIENYFYFNGIPYNQLSFSFQKKIDQLIERIKLDRLYERISLYQDHFFNIIQDAGKIQRQFESDLPADITKDIIKAYLKITRRSNTLH
jgi:hypothetical protein